MRQLLAEELDLHCNAPFQGFASSLRVAAFLLALEALPEDAPRLWEARSSNFDTALGFPECYFCRFIPENVLAFDLNAGAELIQFLHAISALGPDERAEMERDLAGAYPSSLSELSPRARILLAVETGDTEGAKAELMLFAKTASETEFLFLSHEFEQMGMYSEAVEFRLKLLRLSSSAFEVAHHAILLAHLLRVAGQIEASFAAICDATLRVQEVSQWAELGLGRSLVGEWIELSIAAEGVLSANAIARALKLATFVKRLPLVHLRRGVVAARRQSDSKMEQYFTQLRNAEAARIGQDPDG